jgi:hypothetical protein
MPITSPRLRYAEHLDRGIPSGLVRLCRQSLPTQPVRVRHPEVLPTTSRCKARGFVSSIISAPLSPEKLGHWLGLSSMALDDSIMFKMVKVRSPRSRITLCMAGYKSLVASSFFNNVSNAHTHFIAYMLYSCVWAEHPTTRTSGYVALFSRAAVIPLFQ